MKQNKTEFDIICEAFENFSSVHFSNTITSIQEFGKTCTIDTMSNEDLLDVELSFKLNLLVNHCKRYKIYRGDKCIARSALI